MEIKHLLSWTWVQYTSNQQTSIAILIKDKLKLKKFQAHGGPLGSTSSQASTLWTRVFESNQCGAGSLALANQSVCTTTSPQPSFDHEQRKKNLTPRLAKVKFHSSLGKQLAHVLNTQP
jgi:hypothetical protein